jgi:anti-anti-sigma factor
VQVPTCRDLRVMNENLESVVMEYRPRAYPALEAAVLAAFEQGATRVILDLSALDGLDTEGVRGLITLLRRVRAVGGEIALSSPKPEVLRTLQVTALDRLFPVVEPKAA